MVSSHDEVSRLNKDVHTDLRGQASRQPRRSLGQRAPAGRP
mgnify:CR=1 FL=1